MRTRVASLVCGVLVAAVPVGAEAQSVRPLVGAAWQISNDAPPVGGPGWTAGFATEGGVQFATRRTRPGRSRHLSARVEMDRSHSPTNELGGGFTIRTDTTSWTGLFGMGWTYGRGGLDLLIGGTRMSVTVKQTRVVFPQHDSHVAPTIGIDIPIALTRHLMLAPSIRANFAPIQQLAGESVSDLPRGRLGIRWVF